MWPWQRNGEQPNHILIRRLLALSSIGHACLLMFLFVFYHDDATNVSRDVIAVLLDADVTIVRVPLSKVVNKTVPVIGSRKKSGCISLQPKAPAVKDSTACNCDLQTKSAAKSAICKSKKRNAKSKTKARS